VADLEERALRRDRGFLARLVLALVAGAIFGLFVYGKLTSSGFAGCLGEAVGADPDG